MLIIRETSFYVKMSNGVDLYSIFKAFARFSKLFGPISMSLRSNRFYLSKFDKLLLIVRSLLSLLCLFVKLQDLIYSISIYYLKPYHAFLFIENQLCIFFLIFCYVILALKVNYYLDLVNNIITLCKKMESMNIKLNFKMIEIFYNSVFSFLQMFFLSIIVYICPKNSFRFQDMGNLCMIMSFATYMCFECNIALFIGIVKNILIGLKISVINHGINQFQFSKLLKYTNYALCEIYNIVKNMNKIFIYLIFRLTLIYICTSLHLCSLLTAKNLQLIIIRICFIVAYYLSLFPTLSLCVSVKNEVCM